MTLLNLKKALFLPFQTFENKYTQSNYTHIQLHTMKLLSSKCLFILLLLTSVFTTPSLLAQSSEKLTRIRGTVIDKETKEPLPFVAIAFKGTSIGTTTDFDGKYELSSQFATETLEVSFIGYTTFTTTIKLGEKQLVDVELASEAITFDKEVVVKAKKKPKAVFKTPKMVQIHAIIDPKRMKNIAKVPTTCVNFSIGMLY